jgi:3-deoxy-7-phosphoheptulonate synthase
MIESNLVEGRQNFDPKKDDASKLKPGLSITDACVNLKQTEKILSMLNEAVKKRNNT